MKTKLNIYSNEKINKFLQSLLSRYDLIFMRLELVGSKIQNTQPNIIIINNDNDNNLINFGNLNDNYLIINNLKKNINLNNKFKFINTPVSINYLKNTIDNFIQNLEIVFHDISIDNEKITNISNDLFCYLTKIEIEILTHLIREKEISKNTIKENVLNIKSNMQTNSLESHLTRIRKKMNTIGTFVKIQTKNEKLLITT